VLQLIAEGHSIQEIAVILFISVKTVRTHRSHLMEKLDLRSEAELTLYAVRKGVISLDP
jgi:two-component system response regulator NreC